MGVLKTAIQNLLGWGKENVYSSRVVNANNVLFTSYGNDIHASDIVATALHRVCEEVSKCKLKSIIEHNNPHTIDVPDDDINKTFNGRVNPLCGQKDFLYKVAYITQVHKNCFIYWQYDNVPIVVNGKKYVKRVTKGFYPIEAANVKMYMLDDEMRLELTSIDGTVILDMPYSDVIHIRQGYGANRYMGGGRNGGGNYKNLLDNLQTMHVIHEAIPKSLEASLSLKGILSMKTIADVDKKTVTREEFEKHLFDSKYGIVATDYESEFTPINIAAADIPSNTLSFIRDEILAPFGVSLPIWLGKYTDDEFAAFYQTAVEGILASIAEAFKITLFTEKQLAYGHKIKYYDRLVQSLSLARRMEIVKMTQEDALLSRPERRELLGYEPDDQPTRVSLNYIDVSYANEYQLENIKKAKNAPAANADTDADTDNNTPPADDDTDAAADDKTTEEDKNAKTTD